MLLLLAVAGLWAGVQNALAGGGSFVTLPVLILSGLDARSANITSTIALFPGQLSTGFANRRLVAGAGGLPFWALVVISLMGGGVGALLLLATPPRFFERLVPYLVLVATAMFAWGSFGPRRRGPSRQVGPLAAGLMQGAIAVYGGYFGGGIGFLMLAALALAGVTIRSANASKNVLAGMMNASAVAIFAFSGAVDWLRAAVLAVGAVVGGLVGAWLLTRVNDKVLRIAVVGLGLALTIGLFLRAP